MLFVGLIIGFFLGGFVTFTIVLLFALASVHNMREVQKEEQEGSCGKP